MQNGSNPECTTSLQWTGRRVDLFITELYVGGAEKCLTDLALFLKKQGAAVRVFSLASLPLAPEDSLVQRMRQAGVDVYALGADRVWNAGSAIIKLRKYLHDSPPDVLQSFLFHANMIASAALVGLPGRRGAASSKRLSWVAGVRVADPRKQRLAMESLAFRRADRIVAVSQGARLAYQKYSPIHSSKWSVISNGIELSSDHNSEVSWQSQGLPADAKVALFVGRLDAQKGVTWLIDTASDWLSALPQHHLVIAGKGNQLAMLQKQLAQLQSEQPEIAHRIHCVGWLAEPRNWMRASEVLLLPARYEGMPNVCLEAMAERRPIVAFDVQGIRELLGEPGEGQVVPPQNREAWQSAIGRIATDEQFRLSLGTRNREKIERDFRLSLQLQKYADLYFSLG